MQENRSKRRPSLLKKLRYFLEYLAARCIVSILQIVPMRWSQAISRGFAMFACDVLRFRQQIIDENLRHVFADMTPDQRKQLARDMWFHLAMMICEIAQAPRKIHETNWRKYVYIRDRALMTRYFLDWRPVVMVSGHFGNFELAIYMSGILGIPTYAIARQLDNPWLQKWLTQFRESRGQFILPSFGSASKVQTVLDAGGMLSLLGDQHAGTKGCWIDFLGRPAACHKALALFTLRGHAPMMVTYAIRTAGLLKCEIGCNGIADPQTMPDELHDVRNLTQWYNDRLEELIRTHPQQYWWVHRRGKEKPVRQTKRRRDQQADDAGQKAA